MTLSEFLSNDDDIINPTVAITQDVDRLQRAELNQVATAVGFGGTEFLRLVLATSAELLSLEERKQHKVARPEQPRLPEPIDPAALMNEE